MKKLLCLMLSLCMAFAAMNFAACGKKSDLKLYYAFDEDGGSYARDGATGKQREIFNAYGESNASKLFRPATDPVRRKGVKGNALLFDGNSNYIIDDDFKGLDETFFISAWVAPRVFEYNFDAGLTAIVGKGDIKLREGFVFGYQRFGQWGLKIALTDEVGNEFVAEFFDPVNKLPLYEWSHIAVGFDTTTGHVAMYFNGEISYENIFSDYAGATINPASDDLYIGKYVLGFDNKGFEGNYFAGLMDELRIYNRELTNGEVKKLYGEIAGSGHPALEYKDIETETSIYDGDRYRPQYHVIPPGMWMNEPHAPFYYNGYYHLFYQRNPTGFYLAQMRWGHMVSTDMVHWKYVKDAVVPTEGVCPKGVWTGGSVIGPDGTPWLIITAGTDKHVEYAPGVWSGDQHVAYAHPKDITDPYLTEWEVETSFAITQRLGMGALGQFRDPFCIKIDGNYYMLVSSSREGERGGTANIYVSGDMRDWTYGGFVFEPSLEAYPEIGINWECVNMLPVRTENGRERYVLLVTPQYKSSEAEVNAYYWIGDFNTDTLRFVPDASHPEPRRMDFGGDKYNGTAGFCFGEGEERRTVVFAIAQGKDAGSQLFTNGGWAHNGALPLELFLKSDNELGYKPIKELETLRKRTLCETDDTFGVDEINGAIENIRGDMLEISFVLTVDSRGESGEAGIAVRHNPFGTELNTESTRVVFGSKGVYVDRSKTSQFVNLSDSDTYGSVKDSYNVRIYLDRSMLEIYIDDGAAITTRVYPKYSDSDYLRFFAKDCTAKISGLKIYELGSAYTDEVVPAYYGNTGSIKEAK